MTNFQRIEVALKLKDSIAAKAKANQQAAGGAVSKKVAKAVDTYKILGEKAGMSPPMIRRAEDILEKFATGIISEGEINDLRSGKVTISRIYMKYNPSQKPKVSNDESGDLTFDQQSNETPTVQDSTSTVKEESVTWEDMPLERRINDSLEWMNGFVIDMKNDQERIQLLSGMIEWAKFKWKELAYPQK
jgi:hypothetical protein